MRLLSIAMILAGLSLVGCTQCGQDSTPPPPAQEEAAPAEMGDGSASDAAPAEGTEGENSDLEMPKDEPMPEEAVEVEGQTSAN